MRRAALAMLVGGLLASVSPATSRSSELRWVVFVRADEGALVAVRSDGRGERTLLESGVVEADAVGSRVVLALVRAGDATSIVRLSIGEGPGAPQATGTLSGLAATGGRVAVERRVEPAAPVPDHLAGVVDQLASARITVLAPPRRPPGTTHALASADGNRYELRFTNDPKGVLSHAEQVNVFVSGSPRPVDALPGALPVEVRGTEGVFSCGASACFLDWEEGPSYAVGEFGRPEDAIDFAESLRPMDELIGPRWREGTAFPAPELVVFESRGETVLESVEGLCECSFRPVDWDAEGRRLLVVTRAEGSTTLTEYGGPEERTVLHEAAGRAILDASYIPEGVALIESSAVGRPGPVRTLDGETFARRAVSVDAEGSIAAVVRGDGRVIVRDLATGTERVLASGAASVSVAPRPVASPDRPEPPPTPDAAPALPIGLAALALAGLLIAGGTALVVARRR